MTTPLFAGIDLGSRALKVVLYDATTRRVLSRSVRDQGIAQAELALQTLDEALATLQASRSDLRGTVATGYGRAQMDFADAAITELTCHARGVHAVAPEARTVIDIGGQDSKVLWLEPSGRLADFVMNDRCAAGTGRFLEVLAARLDTPLSDLGNLVRGATRPQPISSTCVVFAETEIVGLLATRGDPAAIAAGVQKAVASRVAAMVGRRAVEPIILTGGVARVGGMADALAAALGKPVRVAPDAQFTGALGAAILASERSVS